MRKYGIENFEVSLIEETDIPEEREIFWIEQKRSFKQGYNATTGGDGTKYIDYDLVLAEYRELRNQQEVARKLNISSDSVKNILDINNVTPVAHPGKLIKQYDLNDNYIQSFCSGAEAARYIQSNQISQAQIITISNKVRECAKGNRATAYGYKWKY